jgi:hypothetical protein
MTTLRYLSIRSCVPGNLAFFTAPKEGLVYSIFECFARLKFRNAAAFDLDFLSRAGIAAGACGALANRESAEADQGHGALLLQGGLHRIDHGIKGALC